MTRLLLALAVALWSGLAFAATPVTVTADTFTVDEGANQATFSGNVVVVREGMKLWADKVTVRYGDGGVEDVESFDASGNVRIEGEAMSASGSRAVFVPSTQILTMSGNVRIENESGTLTGPELVVDLKTNNSVFTGGSGGRVTGVFNAQ